MFWTYVALALVAVGPVLLTSARARARAQLNVEIHIFSVRSVFDVQKFDFPVKFVPLER